MSYDGEVTGVAVGDAGISVSEIWRNSHVDVKYNNTPLSPLFSYIIKQPPIVMATKPSLVEPTTRYFLHEKLKECHSVRANIYSSILNISIVTLFLALLSFILYTIYVNKPTEDEQREKNLINQHHIMNKIRQLRTVPKSVTNITEHYLSTNIL
jgi:hypothetical protein